MKNSLLRNNTCRVVLSLPRCFELLVMTGQHTQVMKTQNYHEAIFFLLRIFYQSLLTSILHD